MRILVVHEVQNPRLEHFGREACQALTNPQLWNRYAYSQNAPLSFVDPNGLDPEDTRSGLPDVAGERIDIEDLAAQQSFQQLLKPTGLTFTDSQLQVLLAGLAVALGQAASPVINQFMTLPGGYRESGFALMQAESGKLWIVPWDPGHWQLPGREGPNTYNYDRQVPKNFVYPETTANALVLLVHVHPTKWPYGGPSDPDREAVRGGWGLVIEMNQNPVAIFYGSKKENDVTMPLTTLFGGRR